MVLVWMDKWIFFFAKSAPFSHGWPMTTDCAPLCRQRWPRFYLYIFLLYLLQRNRAGAGCCSNVFSGSLVAIASRFQLDFCEWLMGGIAMAENHCRHSELRQVDTPRRKRTKKGVRQGLRVFQLCGKEDC